MLRLLTVIIVATVGFVLGAALRDATRTEPTAAAVDALTAPDLDALRADVAALEQRLTERLDAVQPAAAPPEPTGPLDEAAAAAKPLPEQLTAVPASPSLAELAALRAGLATLEQRLTDRLDALAAEPRATADLEARLEALERNPTPNPNGVEPLPNAPRARP